MAQTSQPATLVEMKERDEAPTQADTGRLARWDISTARV
jgi:hypothetical protein